MKPGAIVSVLVYPETPSPTRRMCKLLALVGEETALVEWADGSKEYVTRRRVREEQ